MNEAKSFDYWDFFAREAEKSGDILYSRIIAGVGGDDELKAMAAKSRPGQPHANMILGAVNFLLLRGAQHPLRRFYATLGGDADARVEESFPVFRDFCLAHCGELEALIAARVTNTNEVGRTAVLHPGFRAVAAKAGAPLNLIEIGPSAGLNMIWDRYGVTYRRDGEPLRQIAADAPLVIECELRGDKIFGDAPTPGVGRRIGLELNPVDLANADDRDWLRALVWPGHPARLRRLETAIDLFQRVQPEIRSGDALALLPDALNGMPEDAPVCVYHTIVTYQFSYAMREALNDILTIASLRRPVWRLAMEAEPKGGDWTNWLTLSRYRDGTMESQRLAMTHPHGAWLEWLA